MLVKIKNLRLRTVIGVYDWEKSKKQDVVLNLGIDFDGSAAQNSDQIEDTLDYKKIRNQVMELVEGNKFNLLEKMTSDVANLILDNPKVNHVEVEVDKPGALRFTDSVSISLKRSKKFE